MVSLQIAPTAQILIAQRVLERFDQRNSHLWDTLDYGYQEEPQDLDICSETAPRAGQQDEYPVALFTYRCFGQEIKVPVSVAQVSFFVDKFTLL